MSALPDPDNSIFQLKSRVWCGVQGSTHGEGVLGLVWSLEILLFFVTSPSFHFPRWSPSQLALR